jgi:CheY-like chemotaxis protein
MHGFQKPKALVVDDEFLIRADIAALFEEMGYQVFDAADAEEALRKAKEGAPPKVVFTDVRMPGPMDGVRLAWVLTEMYPEIKVIVSSGNALSDLGALPSGVLFMPKPIGALALREFVMSGMPSR